MIPVLSKKIDPNAILNLGKTQYADKVLVTGIAKAGKQTLIKTSITSLGHFVSETMVGQFTTLEDDGGNAVDLGVDTLRIKFVDGANQRQLSNDFIPASMLFSPGRVRSADATNNGTTAPQPSQLFYPTEFEYPWSSNSEILCYVENDGDVDQEVNILFEGVRFLLFGNEPAK